MTEHSANLAPHPPPKRQLRIAFSFNGLRPIFAQKTLKTAIARIVSAISGPKWRDSAAERYDSTALCPAKPQHLSTCSRGDGGGDTNIHQQPSLMRLFSRQNARPFLGVRIVWIAASFLGVRVVRIAERPAENTNIC